MEVAEKPTVVDECDIVESLKDQYWELLTRLKYHEIYLTHYNRQLKMVINVITGISTVSTGGMVISWIVFKHLIGAMALIVIAAQVLQAIIPYTVYHKKSVAISFYIPKLRKMVLDLERSWGEIDLLNMYNSEELSEIVNTNKQNHANMELEYLNDLEIPDRKSIREKAEKEYHEFFFRHYNVKPGEEMNL